MDMYIMYNGDKLKVPKKCLRPRVNEDGTITLQAKRLHGTRAEKVVVKDRRDKWRPTSRPPRLQVSRCTRDIRRTARSLHGRDRLDWLMG